MHVTEAKKTEPRSLALATSVNVLHLVQSTCHARSGQGLNNSVSLLALVTLRDGAVHPKAGLSVPWRAFPSEGGPISGQFLEAAY